MSIARAVPAKKRQVKQNVERREASIELLLGAALRLFVSQGFRATNLEQISSAAGLTKGAVYFYFGSKESVLLEVLKRVREVVVDRALEAVDAAPDDPVQRLVAYIHYQARLGITHRDEVLPMRRVGEDAVDVDDGDHGLTSMSGRHVAASSAGVGHEHTRLRSPKAPSIRRTGGQYLSASVPATGNAATRAG